MSMELIGNKLLILHGLQVEDLKSVLSIAESFKIDYSDLYFQSCCNENWVLEDGGVKSGTYNVNNGVGIRVISGDQTGFSYTNHLTLNTLTNSMKEAITIIDNSKSRDFSFIKKKPSYIDSNTNKNQSIYSNVNPLSNISNEEKVELLMRIDKIARSEHICVKQVRAVLSGLYEYILIISTDGTVASDIRPLIKISISVQVEHDGKRDQGVNGGGGRIGYHDLLNKLIDGEVCIDHWTRNAVRMGLNNLDAVDAPAGSMPVVLSSGWPGILIHEAIGHGLESDFNRKGSSIFFNQLGNQVASELCTIVDDATIYQSRGSLIIDDEGTPGQNTILIKDGVLQGYMYDKLNAKFMGTCSTGNGRRESYADLPIPRMTNTYMLPGTSTPEEIINSVNYGIYATNFGGGQVDITSGKFVFSASEAFLIENGRITNSIKGATLIGSAIDIMKNISMVGNDLAFDSGVGICVKNGQHIPVSVGQPTIKLDKITVGGTVE